MSMFTGELGMENINISALSLSPSDWLPLRADTMLTSWNPWKTAEIGTDTGRSGRALTNWVDSKPGNQFK